MSLNLFGRQAAARRDKYLCGVCKKPFDSATTVIAMSLVDVAAEFPWPLFDGSSISMIVGLCPTCSPIVETPQRLRKFLLERASGHWQICVLSQDMKARLLEPAPDDWPTPVNLMQFFEGRSEPLAKHCQDKAALLRYCMSFEDRGVRVVGCFSSPEDIATVYHFGLLFAQEGFGEGPPCWFLDPRLLGPHRVAYLIKNVERTSYIGVVVFDTQEYFTLSWAWLHPSVRRKGTLSLLWPEFESSHCNFKVLAPISPGMQRFLAKHPGHELTEKTGAAQNIRRRG